MLRSHHYITFRKIYILLITNGTIKRLVYVIAYTDDVRACKKRGVIVNGCRGVDDKIGRDGARKQLHKQNICGLVDKRSLEDLEVDSFAFSGTNDVKYSCSIRIPQNEINKSARASIGNRCFYALQSTLGNKHVSRKLMASFTKLS